jgi:prepilin-type N-terminal cleavage/methylation domain-containing protein
MSIALNFQRAVIHLKMRRNPWFDRRPRGFTLIELMLVVAILSLLAAIAIPKFGDMIVRAREAKNLALLGTYRSALGMYYADTEGYYPNSPSDLIGKYMSPPSGGYDFAPISVRTIPHDTNDPLNFVTYIGAQPLGYFPGAMMDTGGFAYRLFPFNPPFSGGRLFINCTHRDTRGMTWSRY